MRKSKLVLSLGLMLSASSAYANPLQGFYISGSSGMTFAPALTSDQIQTKIATNPGALGILALGWGFGNGLRTEIEGSYRYNNITSIATKRVNGQLMALSNPNGHQSSYALMGNVAYDIPVKAFNLPFQPYVGAGVGWSWLSFNNASGNVTAIFNLPQNITYIAPAAIRYGAGDSFAYQAFTGISVPLKSIPGLELTIEDRIFGQARANVRRTTTALDGLLVNGAIPTGTSKGGYNPISNAVLVGLHYSFNAN